LEPKFIFEAFSVLFWVSVFEQFEIAQNKIYESPDKSGIVGEMMLFGNLH